MQRVKAALEMISTVLVILAAGALLWTTYSKAKAAEPAPLVSDVNETIAAEHVRNVVGAGEIAIVEFSDFQCPFCARHAKDTWPTLKKELIDTGKARYVSLHLPLTQIHPYAESAAVAAECAAQQGKYAEMHDALFVNQQSLQAASASGFTEQETALGLDEHRFGSCMTGPDARAVVKADSAEAARLGVNSTPAFFLGKMRSDGGIDLVRRINGASAPETFMNEIATFAKKG
jgi:protein-disulfide isomerase